MRESHFLVAMLAIVACAVALVWSRPESEPTVEPKVRPASTLEAVPPPDCDVLSADEIREASRYVRSLEDSTPGALMPDWLHRSIATHRAAQLMRCFIPEFP